MKLGRNDPCSCGSGKKFKHCCEGKVTSRTAMPSPDDSNQLVNLCNAGRFTELENRARALVDQYPGFGLGWKLLSISQHMQGKSTLIALQKAANLLPNDAGVHNNLGNALLELGQSEDAVVSYRHALQLKPDFAMAHYNLGNALQAVGQYNDAVTSYMRALEIDPNSAVMHCNLGNALQAVGQYNDAVTSYMRALEIDPNSAVMHCNLGNALQAAGQYNDAAISYKRALEIDPGDAETHNNLGCALKELGQLDAALASYRRALALKPEYAVAQYGMCIVLIEAQRYAEAVTCYQKAISVRPEYPLALGMYLHCKMQCCDWTGLDDVLQEILGGIDAGKNIASPFALLACPSSLAQQRRCAEIFVKKNWPEMPASSSVKERYSHDKIRLGYFSADFYNHATAYLIAELLEQHDRTRFEVIGFSFCRSPKDQMRKRIEAAFDRFIDVTDQSDQDIAILARSLEIDIAIDLKGHTTHSRTGIFARRAAPIQVSYLGYPGTMGASYIDYLVADPTLIPVDHRQYYSEKIAYMPDSYQPNDNRRRISERQFNRSEVGLPEAGFVFCCFNNSFKITPIIFDVWMQLLKQVQGSVLWLLQSNLESMQNLHNEARKHGVAPERIVFAPRMDLPDHLARHRLADLFLDTFYCNAHTTASDALWAGLPVLTCLGDTFAGRVAASLLNAIGLPDLITHSREEYNALALELATIPGRLSSIKQRLEKNLITHPLFNTSLFARHIEDVFVQMWERHQLFLPSDHIYVGTNK